MNSRTEATAKKYKGKIAETYEAQRVGKVKWETENRVICEQLNELCPHGDEVILDCPIGSGRLIPYYSKRRMTVLGIDIQDDMLNLAQEKITVEYSPYIQLMTGNILNLELRDMRVHTALAIRIVNLLDTADMQTALRELQRVASHYVMFNIREGIPGSSKWRHPQPRSAVLESLLPSWELWRELPLHEPDFLLYVLRNKENVENT